MTLGKHERSDNGGNTVIIRSVRDAEKSDLKACFGCKCDIALIDTGYSHGGNIIGIREMT